MSFNVRTTIQNWDRVRDVLNARGDISGEMKLYSVHADPTKWATSSGKSGDWFYLEGLVDQDSGQPIHLSCNSVGGDWSCFHVTEYANNLHVGSFRVTKKDDDHALNEPMDCDLYCVSDAGIVVDGKSRKVKVSKKEQAKKEKVKASGGKINFPKKDMDYLIYAMTCADIVWT